MLSTRSLYALWTSKVEAALGDLRGDAVCGGFDPAHRIPPPPTRNPLRRLVTAMYEYLSSIHPLCPT